MRLIDADELKKKAYPFPCAIGVENAVTIRAINEAPTIKLPVKTGEWFQEWVSCDEDLDGYTTTDFECSECAELSEFKYSYCPNCGADMGMRDINV